MKRLSSLQLHPGMVVAQNVLGFDRHLIIAKGTVLTDSIITRLDLYGILSVLVEDTALPAKQQEETPKQTASEKLSYSRRLRESPEFQRFKVVYEEKIDFFRGALNNVVERNMKLDTDGLLENALQILATDRGSYGILDILQNMCEYDDSTFAHCMNVALLCNVLATWLKLSPEQIEMATACGLFHDIGKLTIPHSLITKPGKLEADEYAQIQKHSISGYRILQLQDVDEHILNAALMHHERCDGSGYPMRLFGNQMDPYARIVAIADVYDAMTAARVYREPLCPFRVIEIFEQEGFEKYDVEYLLVFLENVVDTYINNRCRLSDGREADIVYVNKDKLSRPMVKCEDVFINLMQHPDLTIEELL